MIPLRLEVDLPGWVPAEIDMDATYPDQQDRMDLAIRLSDRNWRHDTGGPFGAAVFEVASGRLLAVGVNRVVPLRAAVLHAETVAIALAGQAVGSFDLTAPGAPDTVLVASTEPCAMCYGAVVWSGVRRLVCGASDADARSIGFDEGPKLPAWQSHLRARGIEVVEGVRRGEAAAVLQAYAASGGPLYNPS